MRAGQQVSSETAGTTPAILELECLKENSPTFWTYSGVDENAASVTGSYEELLKQQRRGGAVTPPSLSLLLINHCGVTVSTSLLLPSSAPAPAIIYPDRE